MAKLRSREMEMGQAIGGDQVGERQTHARGGDIGKWKTQLSEETIDHIRAQYREYGIVPGDFIIE